MRLLQGLLDGISAGDDPMTMIHAALEFERVAYAAESERRERRSL
jgi:hypothetical protein